MKNLSEFVKHLVDLLAAVGAVVSVFFTTIVPAVASTLAVAWYVVRFYHYFKDKRNGNE